MMDDAISNELEADLMNVGSPVEDKSPSQEEDTDTQEFKRFILDLEFVQFLAHPRYLMCR